MNNIKCFIKNLTFSNRHRPSKIFSALPLVICLFFSGTFSKPCFANVLGDMQTFAPNTDGLDFITVHSARSLNEGHFAFSNYINMAKDHLLVYPNLATQDRMPYSSLLTEYDFGIAYGITKSFQVSLMAPILLTYEGETKENIHVDVTKGIHTLRPGLKWSFFEDSSDAAAFHFSVDAPQVTNSPYTGNSPQPIPNLELSWTHRNTESSHGVNLGHRGRKAGDRPSDGRMFPLHEQMIFSYGYATRLTETMRFVFEFIGSHPLNKDPYERTIEASSYDLLFGAKHFWWKYLRFDWGMTIEPGVNSLSPTWRVFAGLVYYWKNEINRPSAAEEEKFYTRSYEPATAVDLAPAVDEFSLSPAEADIFEGQEIDFEAKGGRYPYDFKIVSGPGRIDAAGLYQAPTQPGKAIIEVTDQIGQKRQAVITITGIPKADKQITLRNLKFVFAKDELISESKSSLYRDVDQLADVEIKEIIVEGHTDNVGQPEANKSLGRRRAQVVKNILVERLNLHPGQVKVVSYGEDRPLATNNTDKGRQINRRVELKVYYRR